MAILNILEFPDLRLRRKATPVTDFTPELSRIIDDMFETMYAAPGIGLAATQVNIHKQLIVIDISDNKDAPLVFINPRIEIIDQTLEDYDEGCLSVPGFYETVSRPRMVRISALDRMESLWSWKPTVCWQPAFSTKWTISTANCLSIT
jgi:peptide deformylase